MGRANVLYKTKYSCFSSITECFITTPMSKRRYEKWRKKQYGESYYCSLDNSYFITIEEAINSICLNRNFDESINTLKEAKLLDKYTRRLVINYYLNSKE